MSINIFSLASLQPLTYVALILLFVLALLTFFLGRGPETSSFFILKPDDPYEKWTTWAYLAGVFAVMLLWIAIVVANHTTVWWDIVNMFFLIAFSALFIFVVEFIVAVLVFLFILVLFKIAAILQGR